MVPEDQTGEAQNVPAEVPADVRETTEATDTQSLTISERIENSINLIKESNTPNMDQRLFSIVITKLQEAMLFAENLETKREVFSR